MLLVRCTNEQYAQAAQIDAFVPIYWLMTLPRDLQLSCKVSQNHTRRPVICIPPACKPFDAITPCQLCASHPVFGLLPGLLCLYQAWYVCPRWSAQPCRPSVGLRCVRELVLGLSFSLQPRIPVQCACTSRLLQFCHGMCSLAVGRDDHVWSAFPTFNLERLLRWLLIHPCAYHLLSLIIHFVVVNILATLALATLTQHFRHAL